MSEPLRFLKGFVTARTNLKRWQLFLMCLFIGCAIAGVIRLGQLRVADAEHERDNLKEQTAALTRQNERQDRTDQRLDDAIARLGRLENPTRAQVRREIRRFIQGLRTLSPRERAAAAAALDEILSSPGSRGGARGPRGGSGSGGQGGSPGSGNGGTGGPPTPVPPSAPNPPSSGIPAPAPGNPPSITPPVTVDPPPVTVQGPNGPVTVDLPPITVPPLP